jgi:hypothetical protein
MTKLGVRRVIGDHFEPDEGGDPKLQRQIRGQLDQIDYAAYSASKKVIGAALGPIDTQKFERLALAAAQARASWLAAGMALTESGHMPPPEAVAKLAQLRTAYEELSEFYEGLRRAIERGYVSAG